MTSPNDPSTTLFDTSTPLLEERRPTILLDQTFASVKIADFLRKFTDWRVELHGKHFASNCPDHIWIPKCAEKGWIIISCDKDIRRRPAICEAVKTSGAQLFYLGRGGRQLQDYQSTIFAVKHKILRLAKKHKGPFFARITQDANVTIVGLEPELTSGQRTAMKYQAGQTFHQFHRPQSKKRKKSH